MKILRSEKFNVEKRNWDLLTNLCEGVHLNIDEIHPHHMKVWLIGPSPAMESITSSPLFFSLTGRGNVNYEKSGKLGEVGERVNLVVDLIGKDVFNGAYGSSLLYRFITPDGKVCSWLTKSVDLPSGKYSLVGTIKGYDVKHKETFLTRCVVKEYV